MQAGDEPTAVVLRTRADPRAIEVAAKLATGAAEALELRSGASQRLSTVVLEATRNAVAHAYEGRAPGDIEIGMAMHRAQPESGERDEVAVTISDFGNGCPLGPTSAEPPGLGLSVISELSEALALRSSKHRGTELEAVIRLPGWEDESNARESAASHGSRLDFSDPVFLLPVIPRAVAVHASAGGGSVDSVRAAISCGRGIADSIAADSIAADGATLLIDQPDAADGLELRVGPMPESAATTLLERLRGSLDPAQRSSIEPVEPRRRSDCTVLVEVPLH